MAQGKDGQTQHLVKSRGEVPTSLKSRFLKRRASEALRPQCFRLQELVSLGSFERPFPFCRELDSYCPTFRLWKDISNLQALSRHSLYSQNSRYLVRSWKLSWHIHSSSEPCQLSSCAGCAVRFTKSDFAGAVVVAWPWKPFSGQRHVLNLCGAAWKPRSGEAQKSWKILVTRKELWSDMKGLGWARGNSERVQSKERAWWQDQLWIPRWILCLTGKMRLKLLPDERHE